MCTQSRFESNKHIRTATKPHHDTHTDTDTNHSLSVFRARHFLFILAHGERMPVRPCIGVTFMFAFYFDVGFVCMGSHVGTNHIISYAYERANDTKKTTTNCMSEERKKEEMCVVAGRLASRYVVCSQSLTHTHMDTRNEEILFLSISAQQRRRSKTKKTKIATSKLSTLLPSVRRSEMRSNESERGRARAHTANGETTKKAFN